MLPTSLSALYRRCENKKIRGFFTLSALLCLGAQAVHAQDLKVAPRTLSVNVVKAEEPWLARHGLTGAEYQKVFEDYTKQGFRLLQVSGSEQAGSVRYAALFQKTSGPAWVARHALSGDSYQQAFDGYAKQGYRLVYVDGYEVSGKPQYAAIWEKSSGPATVARHGLSSAQYQKAFDDYAKQGYRLVHVDGYAGAGVAQYAGIWEKSAGPATVARHGLTGAEYQKAFDDLGKQGYRVKLVSGYRAGNQDNYAAIWEKTSGLPMSARHGVPLKFYQNVFDNHVYQSYRPRYINSFTSGAGTAFNTIFDNPVFKAQDLALIASKAQGYLSKHNYPGVSLAIAKDGKLIYAAGFGAADKAAGEGVGPSSRFRVASVSKPITAAAVMRLVQDKKLDLDRSVFGTNGYLTGEFTLPKGATGLTSVTLRHLLQHVGGFSSAKSGNGRSDPMFSETQRDHKSLIQWALDNDVFVREPGTRYEYSNFGYCLAGRILEKVTGKSYERAVRDVLLTPSGVTRMEIAANTKDARKKDEVVYYPAGAYDLNVARFDAHGGWIATPSDLLRVLLRVDGLTSVADLLQTAHFTSMTTAAGIRDANGRDPGYALGFSVAGENQSHNGSMSGTLAQLVRWRNGYAYAAVVNERSAADEWAGNLSTMVQEIIDGVSAWPQKNLF